MKSSSNEMEHFGSDGHHLAHETLTAHFQINLRLKAVLIFSRVDQVNKWDILVQSRTPYQWCRMCDWLITRL